ncbi:hypothetical protein ACFYOV_29995 [Streptomyces sp. NPDC005931]|uniref:hypothetical protein n=1 Tax=Streptomyces sp. NPDC005931 TaxID=3364737 RepID=UPI0036B9C35C
MRRRVSLASAVLGATLLAGGAALPAHAAPTATWQPTGEYYSTASRCWADEDYYLSASNVYDYDCRKSGRLWKGMVYAD